MRLRVFGFYRDKKKQFAEMVREKRETTTLGWVEHRAQLKLHAKMTRSYAITSSIVFLKINHRFSVT